MKSFKTSRKLLPTLTEVLNRSKYDGQLLSYNVRMEGKEVFIDFKQEVVGNYFHTRVEEARALMTERNNKSSIPYVTKKVAENPQALKKVAEKYGKRSFVTV